MREAFSLTASLRAGHRRLGSPVTVVAVALLIMGCGGGGPKTSGAPNQGAASQGASNQGAKAGQAAATSVSTVTFSVTGGFTGKVSLSTNLKEDPADLVSFHETAEKQFNLDLTDQSGPERQQFMLNFGGYTGPGTYQVSPATSGQPVPEIVSFELIPPGQRTNNLWEVEKDVPGSCTVTVTSVTPVPNLENQPIGGSAGSTLGFSEVEGTFACPSVPVYQVSFAPDQTPPLAISDGHFDVVMAEGQ